jgi:hypothetical protein
MTPRDSIDVCLAATAAAERTSRLVERVVWAVTATAIGAPMAWWLVEWLSCPGGC